MVNVIRLREELQNKSVSIDAAAEALGIDRATFYRRMQHQGARFKIDEVSKLANMLSLSPQEMQEIFFDEELA